MWNLKYDATAWHPFQVHKTVPQNLKIRLCMTQEFFLCKEIVEPSEVQHCPNMAVLCSDLSLLSCSSAVICCSTLRYQIQLSGSYRTSTPFPLTVASGRFCLPITSLLVFVPEIVYRDLENGMVLIMTGHLKKKKICSGAWLGWSLPEVYCFLSLVQHHFLNDSCWLSAAKGKMLLKEPPSITCVSVLWFHFSVNGSLLKNFMREHFGFDLVPNMLGREQVCIMLGVNGEGGRSSIIPWGMEWKCRRRKTKELLLSSGLPGIWLF